VLRVFLGCFWKKSWKVSGKDAENKLPDENRKKSQNVSGRDPDGFLEETSAEQRGLHLATGVTLAASGRGASGCPTQAPGVFGKASGRFPASYMFMYAFPNGCLKASCAAQL